MIAAEGVQELMAAANEAYHAAQSVMDLANELQSGLKEERAAAKAAAQEAAAAAAAEAAASV